MFSFVPDLITLKIGHCFLLSKYKNTFIWIKMYTVENSSMHSLGVWKRRFSSRVCVVLYDWCGDCSLGWVHESWDFWMALNWSLLLNGICQPGFQDICCILEIPVSHLSLWYWVGSMTITFSLSFWMELIWLLWYPHFTDGETEALVTQLGQGCCCVGDTVWWLVHPDWELSP